jgi:hypothetical protein
MQLIYQQEVRDTLAKITPGSQRLQVHQVSVKSKIIIKINQYLNDYNDLLFCIVISALTDKLKKKKNR